MAPAQTRPRSIGGNGLKTTFIVPGLLAMSVIVACSSITPAATLPSSPEDTSSVPIFYDGFENADGFFDLFPQDGSRWHGSQREPEPNIVRITDERVHSGSAALEVVAVPYDGASASKADISLGNLTFQNGDSVWTEMWLYLPGDTDTTDLFMWDLEAPATCRLNICNSPGRRLYLTGPAGDWIVSDLGKWDRGERFDQQEDKEVSLPTDRWVRVRVYLLLSASADGIMRVWQDEALVLDAVGITLPNETAVYESWQIGITANGNRTHTNTIYLDDVVMWAADPDW